MRGTARILAVISFMLATTVGVSAARAGVIAGSVKDDKTGEVLVGAAVSVVGTKLGAVADLDGKYTIQNVPAGIYSLRVLYSGYAQKVVAGVTVSGNETVQMDITLEPMSTEQGDAMRIDDIYVTAERVRETSASLLTERQRASVIGDAISAEQIRLSPDGNANDALKRVTGLSIVDDKFVFVRGVTDRYNATTLNGVAVTGTDTDSDKKSFNFDLMPASLIASTVVVKTATPDQPGDFSGGLVQVNTLGFPSELLINAGIEGGYDDLSSRADVVVAPGGGSDWKAQDDGSRSLPSGLSGNALAQALPNTWGTSGDQSRMNQSYGLALGNRYDTSKGTLGFIASGTYKTNFKVDPYHQEPYGVGEEGQQSPTPLFMFNGTRYRQNYLWGGLLNFSYQPWGNHQFSFENNYTRSAADKVTQAFGIGGSGDSTRTQTIEWDQRDLYLGQIAGDHEFPDLNHIELTWRVSYSTSDAQEPDRKFASYARVPQGVYILKENLRSWSTLGEDTRSAQAGVTYPIGEAKASAGYLYLKRERSYGIDAYTTDKSHLSSENRTLILDPIDEIFAPENYGEGKFDFLPYSPLTGDYDGTQDLSAFYGMVDTPFGVAEERFRFAGGVRVEDSDQRVESPKSESDSTLQTAQIDEKDALPSANLTYEVTRTSNLRLGYFKSVNRPEFREMANVAYIDFDANQGVIGNPDLNRAVIDNYDVRLEWFPGVGEVLAVSYFYKDMTDAIEEQLLPSPDRYVRTWFNSPKAKNYGYEIEARKHLGFLWGRLENLILQANYTHVDSEVEYTETTTDAEGDPIVETKARTMQGQAPYTLNAGLIYSLPDIRLSMSVLYNRFGQRLDAVGDTRDYDIYEEPRDVLDFALTEQFTPWVRLKFSIKDILAEDIVNTFGTSGTVWEQDQVGTTYAISLAFNL
jgi:TonB-dependent receptor